MTAAGADRMSVVRVLVGRQLRGNRTAVLVMAGLWAANNVAQAISYQSLFQRTRTRASILSEFTSNGALRALYGHPFDITTPTGWLAWRSMGVVVVAMAMWSAVTITGALRGEEESGRGELVLGQPVPRRAAFAAAVLAVFLEAAFIGAVNTAATIAFCVTRGIMTTVDSVEVGLQVILPALLFCAVGAVASQLVGTTRGARVTAAGVLMVAFVLRTVADAGGVEWVRWATPLGWFEELHPPAAPSPAALAAIAASAAVLLVAAYAMFMRRDVGAGLLPGHDSRRPRMLLLGRQWEAALRDNLPQLAIWAIAVTLTMVLMGSLIRTVLDLSRSSSGLHHLLGAGFAVNAFIAAIFSLVQVVVTLLVVTLLVGARGEESSGRLELLLAQPLSRNAWLAGRALLAATAALALSLVSAIGLWAGAAMTGQDVRLDSVVEAALNCIPLILVTAGVASAVLALAPRGVHLVYAPVGIAYLWEALGTALHAPAWSLDLSPYHWLATIPAQGFDVLPAAVLTVVGLALGAMALVTFRRRDLAAA